MKKQFTIILISLFLVINTRAQELTPKYEWPSDSMVLQKLHNWQDWKFGIIIHWGPYSEWGVVESWSLCPEDEPWCARKGELAEDYFSYKRAYENIRYQFNPSAFDPKNGLWLPGKPE